MKNIKSLRGLVTLGCLLVAPGMATAATITYDSSSTPMVADIGPLPTNFGPLNWAFPEFDSALGTLQSVRLVVGLSGQTEISVTATATETDGIVATQVRGWVQSSGADLAGDAPGGTPLGSTGTPLIAALSSEFSFFLPEAGNTASSGVMTFSGVSDQLYTAPDVLAAFSSPGGGTEILTAWALAGTVFEFFSGNALFSQTTSATLTGSVTYEYEAFQQEPPPPAVPEPSSMLLLSSGVIALVGYRIRRRRS